MNWIFYISGSVVFTLMCYGLICKDVPNVSTRVEITDEGEAIQDVIGSIISGVLFPILIWAHVYFRFLTEV